MVWYEIKDSEVILYIKVQPNSSCNKISKILGDTLKINISAPANENRANKELINFLSKTFKISKSDILFLSGKNSKRKILKLPLNSNLKDFIKEKEKFER